MKKYKDGVYDITNEEYHSSDGVSRSQLMLLDKSPYHFWYQVLSGKAKKKDSTPAMILGSAFHTLLLEPHKFNEEYAVLPKIDRRTTKGKEEYAAFEELSAGKTVLNEDQFEQLRDMVESTKNTEIANTLLNNSVFEKSIYWTDEETDIQFKCRPDVWSSNMIIDVKTATESDMKRFVRSSLDYGYMLQAGMMFEACKAIGKPFKMFVSLVVEKEAPYAPAVFMMSEEALQFGVDQFKFYKRKLKECLDLNKWPGYAIQELNVPKYAMIEESEE